jgi:hypothetical protein
MQSDTFLPPTDSDDEDYSSDSSGELPATNNRGTTYDFPIKKIEGERFLDQSSQAKYLEIRNELFTKPYETGRICFYTHYGDGTYKHELDLVNKYKLGNVKNIIGFELITADIKRGHIDQGPFIDLHISEIPHKACKQNEYGVPILTRMKTDVGSDITNYTLNEPQRSYTNYFTPIQLSTLNITLLNVDGREIITNQPHIFFEFELTILRQSLSQR